MVNHVFIFFSAVQILIFHIFICVLKFWFSYSGRLVKILLVKVIVSRDKWKKMVNFKHSIEMWKVNWSEMTRAWDKDEFDSADPSRMRNACYIWTQLKWPCSPWVLTHSSVEHPPGIWEVMRSIPVRDSELFLPHACDMLNNSPFINK